MTNYSRLTKKQLIEKIKLLENNSQNLPAEKILESEELYRVLFSSSRDAIMTLDPPSWKFTSGNKAILDMFKVKNISEFTVLGPWNVSPKIQPDGQRSDKKAKKMIQTAMEKGSSYFEWTHKRMNGESFPATVLLSRVELSNKTLLQATVRDISNEQKTLNALQDSVKKFRDLFENMNDGFALHKIILDKKKQPVDYEFLEVNPVLAQRVAMKPRDIVNKTATELFPQTEKYWFDIFGKVALTGKPKHFTNYSAELDKYYEVRVYCPQRGYFAALFSDVTEQKKSEQELRDEKEITEAALNSQKDTFFLFEPATGKAIRWNKSFMDITGYTDKEIAEMKAPDSYYGSQDLKRSAVFIQNVLKSGHGVIDLELICKNGRKIPTEYNVSVIKDESGEPKYFVSIGRDITEYRKAEEEKAKLGIQLRRAQRLETIGTLAGGIAHDFNNILAPIMGYTEMAMHRLDETDPMYRYLSNVLKAAFRAKDLVEQILLFSKQSEKERRNVDLGLLINEALRLLRPSIPTTIDIKLILDKSCSKVLAESSQLHQVIINLCTNAAQAMEKTGGTLTIELKQVKLDFRTTKLHPNLKNEEYACISIIDTGPGMDDKTIEHIFEPFFTTKSVDKGTGLGLSVVHGIIRGHNGDIIVKSTIGKGSAFHVYLPAVNPVKADQKKIEKHVKTGSETVMIVDDEPAIGEMLKLMLESFGYKADLFKSAFEALAEFKDHPKKHDILLTDLTMPKMTGLELADQVHQLRPELPIVIITGFGDNLNAGTQLRHGIKHVLSKPIIAKDLVLTIEKVLDK